MSNVLKEKEVLKPVPLDGDPDEWPCHVLRQAVIQSKDGKSMVNLLEAELHGPFVVQGKIEVDKQYKSQFLCNPRSHIIEISTDLFSIGDGPDGQVTIWAGGSGGWFEIIPSAAYLEEYENMAAAVKLYYSILDYITEVKQSRKNALEVDKIFDNYSAQEHDSGLSRGGVAELCRIHGVFLLSMMRRPANAKEWKSTSIFKWLVQELPDVIPQLESSSGRRASQSEKNTKKSTSRKPSKSPPTDTTIPRTRSRQKDETLPVRQNNGIIDLTEDMELDLPGDSLIPETKSPGKGKNHTIVIDDDMSMEVRSRGSRRSGKGAVLRLATPKKRPRSDSLSDDGEDGLLRSGKRRRSLAANTNEEVEDAQMEDALENQDVEDEPVEDEVEEEHLKEEEEPEEEVDVEEQLRLGLESVNMPSFEPIGPDGLWKCPRKGCRYFVHGVEEDDVQEQIRKHFLGHAERIKAQLARFKTVKQESRPHLPISHLLEKLRSLGEASRLQEEAQEERIEGKPVPKAIKRKLLI